MYTRLGVHVVCREGCMRNTPTGKKIGTPPKNPDDESVPCRVFMAILGLLHDERTVFMARGILVWALLMGLVSLEVCQWRIGIPLVIVWISLLGLGGLLWAVAFNIAGDDDHTGDTRQKSV
jgi:hypothetical protein